MDIIIIIRHLKHIIIPTRPPHNKPHRMRHGEVGNPPIIPTWQRRQQGRAEVVESIIRLLRNSNNSKLHSNSRQQLHNNKHKMELLLS